MLCGVYVGMRKLLGVCASYNVIYWSPKAIRLLIIYLIFTNDDRNDLNRKNLKKNYDHRYLVWVSGTAGI